VDLWDYYAKIQPKIGLASNKTVLKLIYSRILFTIYMSTLQSATKTAFNGFNTTPVIIFKQFKTKVYLA
jgi:hypothetical protein